MLVVFYVSAKGPGMQNGADTARFRGKRRGPVPSSPGCQGTQLEVAIRWRRQAEVHSILRQCSFCKKWVSLVLHQDVVCQQCREPLNVATLEGFDTVNRSGCCVTVSQWSTAAGSMSSGRFSSGRDSASYMRFAASLLIVTLSFVRRRRRVFHDCAVFEFNEVV